MATVLQDPTYQHKVQSVLAEKWTLINYKGVSLSLVTSTDYSPCIHRHLARESATKNESLLRVGGLDHISFTLQHEIVIFTVADYADYAARYHIYSRAAFPDNPIDGQWVNGFHQV